MATQRKKTLYEILGVRSNATYPEITAAHQQLMDKIIALKDAVSAEDVAFRHKVALLAFQTLSTPISRDAYDAKLVAQGLGDVGRDQHNPFAVQARVPASTSADVLSLHADAASLRADSMSLRAEALSLRAGGVPMAYTDRFAPPRESRASTIMQSVKRVMLTLGILAAIGMAMQGVAVYTNHQNTQSREKLELQELRQVQGITPGISVEARQLELKKRIEDNERRLIEREKQVQADKYREFEEDARRRGARATAEVDRAQEMARDRALREDQQQAYQKEQEKNRKEYVELMRIEREKAQWRAALRP